MDKWNAENIKNMKGTPQKPNPHAAGTEVPVSVNIPDAGGPAPQYRLPREEKGKRAYLKREDFEEHGYIVNCGGCRRMKTGNMTLRLRPHTIECRSRVEKLLEKEENPRCKRSEASFWAEVAKGDPSNKTPLEKEEDERKEETACQDAPQTEQDESEEPKAKHMKMEEKDPQGMKRKASFKVDEEMSDEGIPGEKKRKEAERDETPNPADTDIQKALSRVSNPG